MSLKDYEIILKLGYGAYSKVYKVKKISDQLIYALKKVRISKLKDKDKKNALNEIRFLASIKHPNIISYKSAFFDESTQSLCLVMEYADAGDLLEKITFYRKKGSYMSEAFIWNLVVQLSQGLKCLHNLNIVHRDMKSANVFLTSTGEVKLGDLNVSKVAKENLLHTQTGTPYYASPEVWLDQPYNTRSDLWSFGCVLYEAASLKPPFRADDMQSLYKKVVKGVYLPIPKTFSQDLSYIIEKLLQLNPEKRLTSSEILSLPSIKRHIVIGKQSQEQNFLLKTIEFPETFETLPDSLPRSNFVESPKHRNKSNILPKIRSNRKQMVCREKSESPGLVLHSSNERASDKSMFYLKYYREMVLKENYGLLKAQKGRYKYGRMKEKSKMDSDSLVTRVKSEKITRKQGINKSLLVRLDEV